MYSILLFTLLAFINASQYDFLAQIKTKQFLRRHLAKHPPRTVSKTQSICQSFGVDSNGDVCRHCLEFFFEDKNYRYPGYVLFKIAKECNDDWRHLDCLHVMLRKPRFRHEITPELWKTILDQLKNPLAIWPVMYREDFVFRSSCEEMRKRFLLDNPLKALFLKMEFCPQEIEFLKPGPDPMQPKSIPRKSPASFPLERKAPNLKKVGDIKQEKESKNLCVVCMDNQIDTTLVPCGHSGYCLSCAKQIDKCPECRQDVEFRWENAKIYPVKLD